MIRTLRTDTDDVAAALRARSLHRDAETERVVAETIADVRARGDEALLASARRFDAPSLARLEVSEAELASAVLPEDQEAALTVAHGRILDFHHRQLEALTAGWEARGDGRFGWSMDGGSRGQRLLPVGRAGAYVPGGQAAYPSSVLMNALPAAAAGVSATITTPARPDGTLHPAVLRALGRIPGVRAFKVGGAAAIAGLALGTESIERVDVVVGPGNRYVNEAKRQLWGTVGLDGYAGPSEVAVLADASANARFAAADLLTQIEHAPDNAGFLIVTDEPMLRAILAEVERQLAGVPRESTMRAALRDHSLAILARDEAEACELVNLIAPEHLSLATRDPRATLERVSHAGCVLLGEWTPESAGDFVAGPSHTLPTSGAARFGSPVNVMNFLKFQSVLEFSRLELGELASTVDAFGAMEGFPAHAFGATVRFE